MNKPVYLGFSILELRKILKYQYMSFEDQKENLCYMDIDIHCMLKNR